MHVSFLRRSFIQTLIVAALFTTLLSTCFCDDTFESKILKGTPISEKQFPYVARLITPEALCSGTLVTSRHVLTAAHCFFGANGKRTVGDREVEVRLNGVRYRSVRVTVHSTYRSRRSACVEGETDAAIVELSRAVTGVTPIPLASFAAPIGSRLLVVGYGLEGTRSTNGKDNYPPIGIVNYGTTTLEGYGSDTDLTQPSSLYLFWRFDRGESSIYLGDSGGPIFYDRMGERFIAGVACGISGADYGSYAVATRADRITSWVARITRITPTSPTPPAEGALTIVGGELRFNRSTSDLLELTGTVSVGRGFSPRNKQVTLAIGGYRRNFRLNARGKSIGAGRNLLVLDGALQQERFRRTSVVFYLFLRDTALFNTLPSLGFKAGGGSGNAQSVSLPITITVNRIRNQATPSFVPSFASGRWSFIGKATYSQSGK